MPRIGWPKATREAAKLKGLGLIAMGVETYRHRMEFHGPIEPELADKLWLFNVKVHHGVSPRAAFDEVFGEGSDAEAR